MKVVPAFSRSIYPYLPNISPLAPQKARGCFFYMPIPTVIEMIIGVGTEHQNLIKTPIDVYVLAINFYAVNE